VVLAEMMANGRGGRRDPSTARTLLETAARKGHKGAISALEALREGGGRDEPFDTTFSAERHSAI
jgi:TPR repeat protein